MEKHGRPWNSPGHKANPNLCEVYFPNRVALWQNRWKSLEENEFTLEELSSSFRFYPQP